MATGQSSFLSNLQKRAESKSKPLFGGPKKPEKPTVDPELAQNMRDLSRRLRTLEERYTDLRKNLQITEQNMIAENKKSAHHMRTLTTDIDELKREITSINDKFDIVIRELKTTAKKEDVQVLEKYINLWEPVNFVTSNHVKKMIDEALGKNKEP